MYIAGKLSCPGLYENLSTNSTRNIEKLKPGSIITFLTSRPTCKKTGNAEVGGVVSLGTAGRVPLTRAGGAGGGAGGSGT